eukprot:gene34412-biopygen29040
MRAVLRRCKGTFANTPHALTGYKGKAVHNTFSIPFKDKSKAVYQKPRKYSPGEQEIIDIHCKELLDYGFIEPAAKHCKHASNVVVAGKKDHATGLWTQTRFCVDLRGINRHSLKDNTLLHRPEELYQKVAKARFKTTLDATKAFHQIPMATEEDRNKTAARSPAHLAPGPPFMSDRLLTGCRGGHEGEGSIQPIVTDLVDRCSGEAAEVPYSSDVTVFIVKYVDKHNVPVLFQLGECYYARRGLANLYEVSGSVASRYNKTIACASSGWHLPLGGQTKSPDLKGAIKLAFDDLIQFGGEGRRAYGCVMMLDTHVTLRCAHVLRCMEHPSAKPVYYIFEDDEHVISETAQFAEAYLMNENRKFTQLRYVTAERAAPWVRPALKLLEERLHPPAAVAEQVLRARVAEMPEHMDRDEAYTRTLDGGVQQLGTRAGIPAPTVSGWPTMSISDRTSLYWPWRDILSCLALAWSTLAEH